MSEFEDKIRDSLRRADSEIIPVAPLDPNEIASRAPGRAPRVGVARAWLAVAAAIVLVTGAGFGAWSWLGRGSTVPAAPAPVPQNSVEIDVFSGRENPRVNLDAAVTGQLYAMLSDQEAAGPLKPAALPEQGLGFRGFILIPADTSLPVLRILSTAVYVKGSGPYLRLDDPNEHFYTRVYDAIRPLIGEDVRGALPEPNPKIPNVTATIPPAIGSTAIWVLKNPKNVTKTSTRLELEVTRAECSGGKTGTILPPEVSFGPSGIVIRAAAEPLGDGSQSCPGNDSVTVTVMLPEPVGDRPLIDAACLEGSAVRTSFCADGAARWKP